MITPNMLTFPVIVAVAITVALLWISCGDLASAIERDWHKQQGYPPPPPENATENLLLGPLALIASLLTYKA